ncbi:hypothetical protein [Vibrio mediterranei]|uniref:hypothetical protein n=1 Tax=Vibrio mediterranei TaxID=689 RepID=UPI0040694AE5
MPTSLDYLPDELLERCRQNTSLFDFSIEVNNAADIAESFASFWKPQQRGIGDNAREKQEFSVCKHLLTIATHFSNQETKPHDRFIQSKSLIGMLDRCGLAIKGPSLSGALSRLKKLGILVESAVEYKGQPLKNWRIVRFNDAQSIKSLVADMNYQKLTKASSSQSSKNTTPSNTLNQLAPLTDDDMPDGLVLLREIFPDIMWALAPINQSVSNVGEREISDGLARIKMYGPGKLITQSALTTGLIIIQIAIARNAKALALGHIKKPFEERRVSISMVEMTAFKKSDSGPTRSKIHDDITALTDVRFDVFQLVPDAKHIQPRKNFSVISQYDAQYKEDTPISAEDLKTGNVAPLMYDIVLNESIIEVLCESSHFSSIPTLLASTDTILISLYLFLRRKDSIDFSLAGSSIAKALVYSGRPKQLLKRLKTILETGIKKGRDAVHSFESDLVGYDFNLFGYYLKFGDESDTDSVVVHVDHGQVIRFSGGKTPENRPNKTLKASIANPLKFHEPKPRSLLDNGNIASKVVQFKRLFMKTTGVRSPRYKELQAGAAHFELNHYTSKQELELIAADISKLSSFSFKDAYDCLLAVQEEILPISCKHGSEQIRITRAEVEVFANHLSDFTKIEVSLSDVIKITSKYRIGKLREWRDGEYSDLITSAGQVIGNRIS